MLFLFPGSNRLYKVKKIQFFLILLKNRFIFINYPEVAFRDNLERDFWSQSLLLLSLSLLCKYEIHKIIIDIELSKVCSKAQIPEWTWSIPCHKSQKTAEESYWNINTLQNMSLKIHTAILCFHVDSFERYFPHEFLSVALKSSFSSYIKIFPSIP